MKTQLKDIFARYWIWLLLLFLLSWGTSGVNGYVLDPQRQKELAGWIKKAMHYESAFFATAQLKQVDSLRFKADSISMQRDIISFQNKKDVIKTYTKIEVVEIPVKIEMTKQDSLNVYSAILEQYHIKPGPIHANQIKKHD